ncbi:transcription-repair coupling factor [Arcanobacterium pinnipediorum]|uniref:Transcription-repair-coupling factor n=1 Tax=Arcanobacterium pinnipediorum TaxID=1503041 RepID=A0ABY5AGS3_9ACTO|nr:transcription-repair coupling factor [Arcanobacterium pinnipediorum]USR79206.1 transcription-repair coupling factor [Arcanobacterium pinnipediorum]
MDLSVLQHLISSAEQSQELTGQFCDITIPRGGYGPLLSALIDRDVRQTHVLITATGREADELATILETFLPHESVATLPAWETLPHERLSPRSDTVGRRLATFRRLAHPEEFAPLLAVIVPVRALVQPVAHGLGDLEPVRIALGDTIDMIQLQEQLVNAAYSRVDMIENRGEFAIRGGIIDIFPPTEPHPLRVELFGDEVDDIRSFAVADQRSLAKRAQVYAPPCRELLLTEDVRSRASAAMTELPGALDMLEKIANGIAVEGMESLLPILVPSMTPVSQLMPQNSRFVVVEPERVVARADSLVETTEEFLAAAWDAATAGGQIPVNVDMASFIPLSTVRASVIEAGQAWWTIGGLPHPEAVDFGLREPQSFGGNVEATIEHVGGLARQGWQIVLATQGPGLGRRLAEQLQDGDVPASYVEDLPQELLPGVVYVVAVPMLSGFVDQERKIAVYGSTDLLHRKKSGFVTQQTMPKRRKNAVDPLQLKPGDYVVHQRHGVAQFVKLAKRSLGGSSGSQREYVVLEYAASKRGGVRDQLWVPTDQLDYVTKYSGGDSPSLNKMGGADWDKTKAKARAAVKNIAKELVRLYAKRRATKGHAFGPDTPWQRELEDAFMYVETPDQLTTIDEVKHDMESPEPMDRLISGDVGYGKTEIAVRAAFKAVQDNMQVAILVPTTLLVEQHAETFTERYSGFPVTVASLSRFQSAKEAEEVRRGVREGKIDVVIGTHRLITGDVRFKNLGLVIIDEEQRFGVEHKEMLKQLYPAVDVLSMSATPIPRTLEMAVTGIRQMSTLATPPEERHPILTYVGAHENRQITAAIKRELLRDGQVFYIHNRTQTIHRAAAELAELVPQARVGVAHGKMSETQLEDVIQAFWDKEIDVLVCTTIVETGLDISNANTLIVEDAHKLGLSQLHQLRGRVGRGRERAYAYFLYPRDTSMTETAIERLRTIAAHSELGAGIQVAMKDLEIRGAGNILGGEQSGHIAGVGFDLYLRMVAEAVGQITGQDKRTEAEQQAEMRIELPVEAYVPERWVTSERLRLEIYTKIASSLNEKQREDIRQELHDRYGKIPVEVERLFALAALREQARSYGVEEITVMGKNVRISPVILSDSKHARLRRLYPKAVAKAAVRTLLIPLSDLDRSGNERSVLANQTTLENDEMIAAVQKIMNQLLA